MKSLLIIGGSGFIGGWLSHLVCRSYKIHSSYWRNIPLDMDNTQVHYLRLNISDHHQIKSVMLTVRPAVTVFLAGETPLECAKNPSAAWKTHVIGTEHVVRASAECGSRLVFLSSDLVFDGRKGNYSEQDTTQPVCSYGSAKVDGEKIVAEHSKSYAVIRTSFVYGCSYNNAHCFTETIIDRLNKKQIVSLFKNEYRCPVYIGDLCHVILAIAGRKELNGIFHASGPDRLSRYEFGCHICDIFDLNRDLIIPQDLIPYSESDERPQDCSMCNTKVEKELNMTFFPVCEGLSCMKSMMASQRK